MTVWYLLLFAAMVFAIWRMWSRRHGVWAERKDKNFDCSEGDPEVARAIELIGADDWRGLSGLYRSLEASDRYHLAHGLGACASGAPAGWPDDEDGPLLALRAAMIMAEALRPPKGHVSRRSVIASHQRAMEGLAEAHKLLARAAANDPHDSAILTLQLRAASLARADGAAINGLLGRIEASGEDNVFAALNHLLHVLPATGGNLRELWNVANDYAGRPVNAAWLAIAARAHIEEWRHSMHVDPSLRASYVATLQDDGFKDHVRQLDRQFWRLESGAPMSPSEAALAHNTFAFLANILRLDDCIAAHLDRMGAAMTAEPWNYLPEGAEHPTRLLADLRRAAGLPQLA